MDLRFQSAWNSILTTIKQYIKKINFQYLNIAICRSFIPLNFIIILIFFRRTQTADDVSVISFIIALSQILAQIDGGASSYLLSQKRNGHDGMIYAAINHFSKTGLIALGIIFLMAELVIFFFKPEYTSFIAVAFILSISTILFNINLSVLAKENLFSKSIKILFILMTIQAIIFSAYIAIDTKNFIYPLLLLALNLCLPLIFTRRIVFHKVTEVHAQKLQISQIASSIVINKEYLLLHFFGLAKEASQFSIVGRLMYISIQITSIYISRVWINLSEEGQFSKEKYKAHLLTAVKISLVCSTLLSIVIALRERDVIWLTIALFIYSLTNAISGLSSAFASMQHKAIPNKIWFFANISALYLISFYFYTNHIWLGSVIISCIYFLVLSYFNFKKIKWE